MAGKTNRRTLIGAAGLGLAVWAANRWLNRVPQPDFEPVPGLPGFRRMRAGPVTGGALDPFLGLDAPRKPAPRIPDEAVCRALFRETRADAVPVAFFTDYNCPYCRRLSGELQTRAAEGRITITWHELPLLGERSETAARAALAAGRQGAYAAFHARLMRSRALPEPPYLRALAEGAGLDPARLVADMEADIVDARLRTARGLASRFGFYATPALVVGRTAVLGNVRPARLDALIAGETDGPPACR